MAASCRQEASKTSLLGRFFRKQWWILTFLINIFSVAIPSMQNPCPGKQVSTWNSLYHYSCNLYLYKFNNRHRMCCIFCLSYCLLGFWSRQGGARKFELQSGSLFFLWTFNFDEKNWRLYVVVFFNPARDAAVSNGTTARREKGETEGKKSPACVQI